MSASRTQNTGMQTPNFGTQGYPGMAQGPYSNVGNMMMGQNPYQQSYGGGFQGMYNQGTQPPANTSNVTRAPYDGTNMNPNAVPLPGGNGTVGVDPVTGRLVFK